MSERDQSIHEEHHQAAHEPAEDPQWVEEPGDWLLIYFLDLASVTGISPDITVVCDGVLIAGTPIPDKTYFNLLGESYATAMARSPIRADLSADEGLSPERRAEISNRVETDEEIREAFGRFGQEVQTFLSEQGAKLQEDVQGSHHPPEQEGASEASLSRRPARSRVYINLRRATISRSNGDEIDLPLWRGRLSKVSSWYIGRHGTGPYEGE